METKYLGSTLALAVAGFIASASLSASAGDAPATTTTTASSMTVRCMGINSCKGKGATMVASEKDCTDKKGTVAMVEKTTTTTTTTSAPLAPTPPATPPAK